MSNHGTITFAIVVAFVTAVAISNGPRHRGSAERGDAVVAKVVPSAPEADPAVAAHQRTADVRGSLGSEEPAIRIR